MKNAVLITGGAKRLGSLIAQQLSKENYFISVGRLTKQKNFGFLIRNKTE